MHDLPFWPERSNMQCMHMVGTQEELRAARKDMRPRRRYGQSAIGSPGVMLDFGVGLGDGRAAAWPLVSGARFTSPARVSLLPIWGLTTAWAVGARAWL